MPTNMLASTVVVSAGMGYIAIISPFEIVGVPAAVVFMALIGTSAGMIVHKQEGGRARLFSLVFAYTAASSALAVLLGQIPGLTFFSSVAPATALVVAFFAQSLVPALREALVNRVKGIGDGK